MTMSLRIIAVGLGLVGISRFMYAGFTSLLPGMSEPTPLLNQATGVFLVIAAVGLLLGQGWGRWLGLGGALVIMLQGTAYVVWNVAHSADASSLLGGLIEPIVGALMFIGLLRYRATGPHA